MIKRFDLGYSGAKSYMTTMAEDSQGDYVLHADHIEEVLGLVEVLRKVCASIDGYGCLVNRQEIEREMLDVIAKATGEQP